MTISQQLRPLLLRAIEVNGKDFQLRKLQEECGECVAAVNRYKDGRGTLRDLCSEVADVLLTASIVREMWTSEVDSEIERKLKRLAAL